MKVLWLFSLLPIVGCHAVIKGISWMGLETQLQNTDCSWTNNNQEYYISKLNEIGFNYIRLPFSAEYVHRGDWGVMDHIFDLTAQYNMSVLLDYHRTYSDHQGDWWETNMNDFIATWTAIINRYKDRPQLKSIGIYNEFQGNDCHQWNEILKEAITKLETKFPNRFEWFAGGCRWGGSLQGITLESLPFRDRIRYEVHKYVFSQQGDWTHDWDVSLGDYPPKVVVGEFGWKSDNPDQVAWAKTFLTYLKRRNIRDSFFWVFVVSSGDTGGIFEDCYNIDWSKVAILRDFWEEDNKKSLRGF